MSDHAEAVDAYINAIGTSLRGIVGSAEHIDDRDYLAALLVDLADVKRDVGRVYDEVEKLLLSHAGEKRFEVPGLGQVEIKKATTYRKWQHDDVFRAVIARIADEPGVFWDDESGERFPPHQLAANLVGRLREVLSPSWKVGGLRALNLQPDEYAEVNDNGFSVRLPSRGAA